MSSETKKLSRQLRQQELLKHFIGDFYQEKQVGDKWLVKSFNGNNGKWQVSEYLNESFQKYSEASEQFRRFKLAIEKD